MGVFFLKLKSKSNASAPACTELEFSNHIEYLSASQLTFEDGVFGSVVVRSMELVYVGSDEFVRAAVVTDSAPAPKPDNQFFEHVTILN